jgi:hypothetical protein
LDTILTALLALFGEMMIDENKFWELIRIWEYQNAGVSSSTVILSHPALSEIITMGTEAIPLLLKALHENFHLAYALHRITGEWPVKQEYAGNSGKIIESWMKWAKRRGYRTK